MHVVVVGQAEHLLQPQALAFPRSLGEDVVDLQIKEVLELTAPAALLAPDEAQDVQQEPIITVLLVPNLHQSLRSQ
ncbi:MAG: hypothetical protein WBV74_03675 [Pseudonocardiaceae bacterium]